MSAHVYILSWKRTDRHMFVNELLCLLVITSCHGLDLVQLTTGQIKYGSPMSDTLTKIQRLRMSLKSFESECIIINQIWINWSNLYLYLRTCTQTSTWSGDDSGGYLVQSAKYGHRSIKAVDLEMSDLVKHGRLNVVHLWSVLIVVIVVWSEPSNIIS